MCENIFLNTLMGETFAGGRFYGFAVEGPKLHQA